jgi:hypothetical protein
MPLMLGTPAGAAWAGDRRGGGGSTLLTGVVCHYPLSGLTDSAGGPSLVNDNGVTFVAGKVGNCANFVAASSQQLRLQSPSAVVWPTTGALTVAAWMRRTAGGSVRVGRYDGWDGNNKQFLLRLDGAFRFFASPDGTNQIQAIDTSIAPGNDEWFCLFGIHDPVAAKIYVGYNDNPLQETAFPGGLFNTPSPFTVGSEYLQNYSNGMVDDPTVWNRVLTADERAEYYNAGAGNPFPFG